MRDLAGNWSAVQSATLTVVPDAIFVSGFEVAGGANAPWGWSSATPNNNATRLTANATAALVGARGLQAQNSGTNFVQYNFATATSPATATFDARFNFRPNANATTGKDIFAAATNAGFGTQVFSVRYRLSGTQPQVQIQVGATASGWSNVNDGASNVIEVVWRAGTGLTLYVNGASAQTITSASAGTVGAFRLGSVTTGGGNNTNMYFDNVAAKRTTTPLLGP